MKTTSLFFFVLCISALTFGQTKTVAKCQLWTPNSFCELPQYINVPCKVEGQDCYWNFISCEEVAKKTALKGVRVTFSSKTDSVFILANQLENFSLKGKTSGKTLHPVAILWHNEKIDAKTQEKKDVLEYMSSKFKAKKYLVKIKPGVAYDLVLLFTAAETGDTFTIDNFMEVKVGGKTE